MKNHALMAALALALGAPLAHAHGDAAHAPKPAVDPSTAKETPFGKAGDPKRVGRVVRLTMSDAMRFSPSELTVRRGETIRFVASNQGQVLHEMVIGTDAELRRHAELMKQFPDMEHDEAYMTHVRPGARGEIVWQFTRRGRFAFACLIPGHYEAGMVGSITVK